MADIIDGKALAESIREKAASEAVRLKKKGVIPGLAVVLVGDDPASAVYVKNKNAACEKAGIASFVHRLSASTSHGELLSLVSRLSQDDKVHGILVQLPLPKHIDAQAIICAIPPGKDVDGFHPVNIGKLVLGDECLTPCTPAGCIELIRSTGLSIRGKSAVIVGRSNIVGKPLALMLLQNDATVTVCHSKTEDLPSVVGGADILVAAIGRPRFIEGSWVKKGSVVIDVGINRTDDGKLVGDVDFDEATKRASHITPVPGGVGPMTIAMLLKNTVKAAKTATGDRGGE